MEDEPIHQIVISAIVVSYNTRELTLDCLRALCADLEGLAAEIFVVDNGSSDGSPAAVIDAFPQVRVITNDGNLGFGSANNQAMQQSSGEFLLLLNSDAFPAPGAVSALLECLRRHPEAAVAGPRLVNRDGSLQRSCYRFPGPLRAWLENLWIAAALPDKGDLGDYSGWAHDEDRLVDFVIGACMLVRRRVFEQIGGFDEAFFMYGEETDWQRRMQAEGWKVVFCAAARVTHLGGASGARSPQHLNRYVFESLDRYELKHHGLPGLVSLRLAMVTGCLLRAYLWTMASAVPARRPTARCRARHHAQLCVRQLTHWRLPSVG